jgi:hypothetical protein
MLLFAPKYVAAVLMSILILFLKQFTCASGDRGSTVVKVLRYKSEGR